jgi:hypothetical protein
MSLLLFFFRFSLAAAAKSVSFARYYYMSGFSSFLFDSASEHLVYLFLSLREGTSSAAGQDLWWWWVVICVFSSSPCVYDIFVLLSGSSSPRI